MTCRERCADVVVGVRQSTGDLALVQIRGADLDVTAVGLQPAVVFGSDPVAEDVHGLRLAAEVGGELLGDEDVWAVCDIEDSRNRVVIGDRYEIHAASLGQGIDLFGRGGALRQADSSLDTELRYL